MTGLADYWWWWIGARSLQLCLLVPAVALLDRLLARRAWPGIRTGLWAALMLGLVIPPIAPAWLRRPLPLSPGLARDALALGAEGWLVGVGFGVWVCGVLVLALAAVVRWRSASRRLRAGAASPGIALAKVIDGAAAAVGLRRPPLVVIGRRAPGPCVVGIRRPLVVLPEATVRASSQIQIEHVLLHEFAHVKRRDALFDALAVVVQIAYWFHPLVWLARRRLAVLREIGCDARAAEAAGDRDSYRRTLVSMARPLAGAATPALGLFGLRSQLITRLAVLESPPARASRLSRALAAGAATGILLASTATGPYAPPTLTAADAVGSPPGCLQLRYAVYALLAEEARQTEGR